MQDHLAATIESINKKIADLTTLRDGLVAALAPMPDAPPRVNPSRQTRPTNPTGLRRNGSSGRDAERIVSVARKLQGLITITGLSVAAGIPKSSACSTVTRWVARGWLKKTGYGEYTKTPAFGGNSEPPALVKGNLPELKRRLADCCKQRDAARSNGRDTIVEMFQDEINQLESKISQLEAV